MISFLTSSAGIAFLGSAMGFLFRYFAQRELHSHQFLLATQKATTESQDAADKRGGTGGTWTRRVIFAFIAVMFLFLMVAAWQNIPTVVEVLERKRFLFWSKESTSMVPVDGYFFPEELRRCLIYIVTFYFGQAVKGK